MYSDKIQIQRIANGYNIMVPSYPKPFNPSSSEKELTQTGNFIPKKDNIFFKSTLKEVFEFLTEIENNPQPIVNYGFGFDDEMAITNPAMIG